MPEASIGQQKGPNSSPWQCLTARCTNKASKQKELCYSFTSAVFTCPLTNQPPLPQAPRQAFAGKTLPQPAGSRKRFPRVRQLLRHGVLCYWNKQTHFSLAKTCWLLTVPILIYKDEHVFEPSYNDLKFRIQNFNYFCTNLIVH